MTLSRAPGARPIPEGRVNNFWYARRDPNDVIVFVHGIFSSSLTCWRHEDDEPSKSVFWPDLVLADPRFGSASIYLAGYYTAIDAGDFPLHQCASQVFAALEGTDADGSPPVLDATRLTFVCHSTGGVVARYIIESKQHLFRDKQLGLALIASPSLGSRWATLAEFAATYYNQQLGRELRWRGDLLTDLDLRFKDLVASKPPIIPNLFGMEAAENKMVFRNRLPKGVRWLFAPRWTVVDTLSAARYFGAPKTLENTDHFSTVKPTGSGHPAHVFLATFRHRFLHAVGADEPKPTRQPNAPDDLDAQDWPASASDPVTHLFVCAEGFADGSDFGIATCVVADAATIERNLAAAIQQWLKDPAILEIPGLATIVRRRDLAAAVRDSDLRARLLDWLSGELFEAYVCYTRTPTVHGVARALAAVVQDRIVAHRSSPIRVRLSEELRGSSTAAADVIDRARSGPPRWRTSRCARRG